MMLAMPEKVNIFEKESVEAKRCQKRELAGILQIHLRSESRLFQRLAEKSIFLGDSLQMQLLCLFSLCVTLGFELQMDGFDP